MIQTVRPQLFRVKCKRVNSCHTCYFLVQMLSYFEESTMSLWQTLPQSWAQHLPDNWLNGPTAGKIEAFLQSEKNAGATIYPPDQDRFTALQRTAFENVKVVIVGQDPYHGPNQAHGLSFSVRADQPLPPSLRNIYKELKDEFGSVPPNGDLSSWADQGVLLLNTVLSVRASEAASHQGQGWEEFTDLLLKAISNDLDHVVFILWGSHAQKKSAFIDTSKHLIISSAHPSPLSAHRGFLGSKPFAKTNEWLRKKGKVGIEWVPGLELAEPFPEGYKGRWER